MKTPYQGLPDHQFHSRAVKGKHPSRFDPVVKPKFRFDRQAAIMTMGSCFAQHLSRWLLGNQFNLLLREKQGSAGGVFSANYGNVYTVQQALQLFQRAFGHWQASDDVYVGECGGFFDPLRPSILAEGFDSKEALLGDRQSHQAHVRELFLSADVLVFTLGLTEAWVRNADGAVLPVAPGVVAGDYDSGKYSFHNYSYAEVVDGLRALLLVLREVNPGCQVLLTVSPVPLAATYESRHVTVASMASKAVLRAAAEAAIAEFEHVDYFPSFEIFFTPGVGAGYFDVDARHVLPAGVAHAMRLFDRHYTDTVKAPGRLAELSKYSEQILIDYYNVNCDEGKIG